MDFTKRRVRTLGDLLAVANLAVPSGLSPTTEVKRLTDDSRRVEESSIFVAVSGAQADGRKFLKQAAEQGAMLAIAEPPVPEAPLPIVETQNTRLNLTMMAHAFHGYPTREMLAVGVTGTNGKTTTTFLLEAVMKAAGMAPGVIGTIEGRFGGKIWDAPTTTPGAVALAEMLADMRAAGADALAIEVSSHAIDQHRVTGVDFDAGIFTNLSQDHLDYHGTMEEYAKVKLHFFTKILAQHSNTRAVTNIDDPTGEMIGSHFEGPVVTYGQRPGANVLIRDYRPTMDGMVIDFRILGEEWSLNTALVGPGNVQNIAATVAWAHSSGIELDVIQRGLETVKRIPGRLELIDEGQSYRVVVDYSHTPASLEGALNQCREIAAEGARVIVVFGCGGDRDPIKRPIMGKIAGEGAELVWLTSDNPRTEDPKKIADQALEGLKQSPLQASEYAVILDRREAIEAALAAAKRGDVVLIAGKGHETYQEIGKQRFPFDDAEVARQWLRANVKE